MDEEAIATSASSLGKDFRRDAARVYIVASVAGGTGSGMVLDVAYAVRTVLQKLDLPQVTVTGVLLHATGRDPRHCELARVNVYSWLTEFHHFHQVGNSYPGDSSCGLPPQESGMPAFDNAYLVHLGECLDDGDFDQGTQSVADYLRLDALTPAQVFLDACRISTPTPADGEGTDNAVKLRSFGIYWRSAAPSGFCEEAAAVIGARLLASWRKTDGELSGKLPADPSAIPGDESIDRHNEQFAFSDTSHVIQRLQLTPAGIAAHARVLMEAQLESDAGTFLSNWIAQRFADHSATPVQQLLAVDDVFGDTQQRGATSMKSAILGQSVETIIAPLTEKLRAEVRRWILRQLDDPRERLAGTTRSAAWLRRHVGSTVREAARLQSGLTARLLEVRSGTQEVAETTTTGSSDCAESHAAPSAITYLEMRLDQLALGAVEYIGRHIHSDLKAISDDLTAFGRELTQMAAAGSNGGVDPWTANITDQSATAQMITLIRSRLDKLSAEVDARLQAEYLRRQGGLFQTIMQGGRPRAQLGAKLHEFARQAVQKALNNIDLLGSVVDAANESAAGGLRTGIEAATPALMEFGGGRRVFGVLPAEAVRQVDWDMVARAVGTHVTAIEGGNVGFTLCVEAQQLSMPHVALSLVQRRRDSIEFAKRVHCRSDVKWTPLLIAPTTSRPRRPDKKTTQRLTEDHAMRQTEVV